MSQHQIINSFVTAFCNRTRKLFNFIPPCFIAAYFWQCHYMALGWLENYCSYFQDCLNSHKKTVSTAINYRTVKSKPPWTPNITVITAIMVITVECVYCTEHKATCRQCKNQPNAYNMYTDLEGILSACLYVHVSFHSGVVYICRYAFSMGN